MKGILKQVFMGILWAELVFIFAGCQTFDVNKAVADFIHRHTGNGSKVDLNKWQPPEEMRKNLVYYLSGFDEDDRPIWVAEWGKWDVRQYWDAGGEKFKTFDNYLNQQIVRMLQSIKLRSTKENPVDSFIFIVDMEDYPIDQITSTGSVAYQLRKFAGWTEVAQAIHKGFIINTNFVAERMVNLVRPILGGVFARFEIYGTNKAKWLPRLLKHVPRSQIPEWYGGTKDFKPVKVYGR